MRRIAFPSLSFVLLLLLMLTVSSAHAQEETVRIVVYRDAQSLTLYLPDAGFPDITGLYIEATTAVGEIVRRDLAALPAFRGLPYNRLPAPICFYMISASSATLPLDCQTTTTLTQMMAVGDVFWHEQGDRTLVFYLGEIPQICPAGAPRCTLVFPALATPTPTATITPTHTPTATPTNTATVTYTPTPTPIPLGYPGNSVTSNDQWTDIVTQVFDGVTMVLVPAGSFTIGANPIYDDERNGSVITFDRPFWIDLTEVTQFDFERFGGEATSPSYFTGDQRPVEQITWFEARAFCALREARLPTELEWEYAARGPSEWEYPWGNSWNASNAVWNRSRVQGTANVGSIPSGASWVGALDMIGNVWEWVSSSYLPYDSTQDREAGTGDGMVVLRGGSWKSYDVTTTLRGAVRGYNYAINEDDYFGFRCVRDY